METLRYLPHLSELNLDGNQITSLLPLASIASTEIWYLRLSNNRITDITGLELFTGLIYLQLDRNQISSISGT
jgi:Leucine-rich repeat (LRR) protein